MNEKGFSLLETLLAFTIIIFVLITIIPLFHQLIITISDKKLDLTATRLLSEFVSIIEKDQVPIQEINTNRGVNYVLNVQYDDTGELYACVQYKEKKKCIK